jgi:Polyketide cyclase / dehydrase and lipid transport
VATNRRLIHASPHAVWNVLADGWLYPVWVVGATRVRDVDENWPEAGSKIHHSVGVWPMALDDDTEVVEARSGTMLTLRARGWPIGEASVRIRLTAAGAGTDVVIEEDAVRGPGTLVPEPVRRIMLKVRNVETLKRLAYVAEGRHVPEDPDPA